MIPQDGTKRHGNGSRGNCLQAVVATLLSLPLSEVPSFENLPAGTWKGALAQFVAQHGLTLNMSYVPPPANTPHIGIGPHAKAGVRHAVVMKDGQLLHDPHRARLGLRAIERYMWFSAGSASDFSAN